MSARRSDSTDGEARAPSWPPGCWPRPALSRASTWPASPCTVSNAGGCRWWPSPAFDDEPIREKTQIYTPDALVVIDPALLSLRPCSTGSKRTGF